MSEPRAPLTYIAGCPDYIPVSLRALRTEYLAAIRAHLARWWQLSRKDRETDKELAQLLADRRQLMAEYDAECRAWYATHPWRRFAE